MRFQDLSKLFLAAACAFNFACNSQDELVDNFQESDSAASAATTPDAMASSQEQALTRATGRDSFGVQMLYPSKPGGDSWTMSSNPTHDPRFNPQNPITQNADGSWKMKAGEVRMLAYTSEGFKPNEIKTYNRDALAKQGYMQSPADWKNVEITGYVKANVITDPTDNFCWYARGGRHSSDKPCEGSAYKADLHYDGTTRLGKESWHVNYAYTARTDATTPLKGRWIGFKAVIRNVTVHGVPAVKVEAWVDNAANGKRFKKVYEYVDDGTWDGNAAQCGAKNTKMPFTWGGPVTTFRWDNTKDVDFKWLSVREIGE